MSWELIKWHMVEVDAVVKGLSECVGISTSLQLIARPQVGRVDVTFAATSIMQLRSD